MLLPKVLLTIAIMLLITAAVDYIVLKLHQKEYKPKTYYSGKPRSGKSILIEREKELYKKLQKDNSKEDVQR